MIFEYLDILKYKKRSKPLIFGLGIKSNSMKQHLSIKVWIGTLLLSVFLAGCGSGTGSRNSQGTWVPVYEARYAERFQIWQAENDGDYVLRVLNPWQGADRVVMEYRLVADTLAKLGENQVRWPIRRAVCMSSSHVAFLDAVGEVSIVKGVSGVDFVTNPLVNREHGVKEVGYDSNLDFETIVGLRPDVVFMFGVSGDDSGAAAKLKQLGVPVVYIADYLEQNPLGRAEWIVPFGLMTNRIEEAVDAFMHIESHYTDLQEAVAGEFLLTGRQPKVMLNSPYKDVWYLPGDRSYIVELIRDAGGVYLGAGDDSDVSRPVSSEKALLMLMEADYWLNPGMVQTMAQLKADNRRFATLPVVEGGEVYNNNARSTPAGGSDFWESGAVRPDVVLRDMVQILHPGLVPDTDTLYYFHRLR